MDVSSLTGRSKGSQAELTRRITMRRSKFLLLILGLFLIGALAAYPQTQTEKSTSTKSPLTLKEKMFIKNAAEGGLAEVEMGQLAKDNSTTQDVKDFGNRMIEDHGKANDELKALATQKNVDLPEKPGILQRASIKLLSGKKGDDFDKAYMKDLVKDHNKDVSDFKKESTAAKDPDLKAWVDQTLPTLEEHLKQAKDVAAKVGATGSTQTKKSGK
jgi:putative membrane protein